MTMNPTPSPGRRLLLVEDDRLVRVMMVDGLTEAGFDVVGADSAEDAEAWLAGGERPDLAILDVRMQGLGGLHLAQRLHELDHIPFMMLSAYSDPETVAQATRFGALAYAIKPQDVPQLAPTIEAALARANELQALRETRQQLQTALDVERNVSVATGIAMAEYRLKRSDAFALLRDAARKQRRKLADLAGEIILAREALSLDTAKPEPSTLSGTGANAIAIDSAKPLRP